MPEKSGAAGGWQATGGGANGGAGNASLCVHHTTPEATRQGPVHGRTIGDVWRKTARKSEHLLRVPKPSWCVDLADLGAAEKAGARWLDILEQEEAKLYRVALAVMRVKGEVFDRGYGQQVRLPLGYFQVTGGEPEPAAKPMQLNLFQEALR